MKRNMKEWKEQLLNADKNKPMPILSFPGANLINASVDDLVRDGHLQALCMESIAKKYDCGMAVSLMDLSVEAEAFGANVCYSDDEVPTVNGIFIHDEDEAEALVVPEVGAGRTGECIKCIEEAVELITDRPVFAGIIGPYTLAGRLLDMTEIMILCYEEPEMVETVIEKATAFLIEYAKALKNAGANGLIMAEPAAGLLSPNLIAEFSTPYVNQIRQAVEDDEFLVVYHNCGNVEPLMQQMVDVDAQVYSLGNAIHLEKALEAIPSDCLVMGNIDPAGILRNGTPEQVYEETKKLMETCGKYPNFILSSGCDIPPLAPFENIDAFFKAAEEN